MLIAILCETGPNHCKMYDETVFIMYYYDTDDTNSVRLTL